MLQLRLLKKQLTTKFLFILGAKKLFFPKKWWHHQEKVISLNLYIGTNCFSVWKMVGAKSLLSLAQRFHHYIDSHCLCMWVNARLAQRFRHYIDSHCLCMWVNNMDIFKIFTFLCLQILLFFFSELYQKINNKLKLLMQHLVYYTPSVI